MLTLPKLESGTSLCKSQMRMTIPLNRKITTTGKFRSTLTSTPLSTSSHRSELRTRSTQTPKLSSVSSPPSSNLSTSEFSPRPSSGGTIPQHRRAGASVLQQGGRPTKSHLQLNRRPLSESATKSFWTTLRSRCMCFRTRLSR